MGLKWGLGVVCVLAAQMAVANPLAQPLTKLQQIMLKPARLQLLKEAKEGIQQFDWQQQPLALQQEMAQLAKRYPKPKYQFYSAHTQAIFPTQGARFELQMWHKLTPKPERNIVVWDIRSFAHINGEEFNGTMQAAFHPHMGFVQVWLDNDQETKWKQLQSQQQVERLADGSLPKRYRGLSVTQHRSLLKPNQRVETVSICTAGVVYAGKTVHPHIKGRVQDVTCVYESNDGTPENRVDMVYLLDYQVFIPTWEHYAGHRWQWQMLDFQGS